MKTVISKSLWQTQDWQHMLQKSAQTEVFFEEEGLFIEKRSISLWKYGLFVTGITKSVSQETVKRIQDVCKREKCLFVQYETLSYTDETIEVHGVQLWCYKKFIPAYTCVIDLQKSQEDILADMKPKGRYNIRLAEKKGVKIEQVEKNPYNVEIFHRLISETTNRNDFSGNTQQYYEIFLKSLKQSQLLFAYYEDTVIAAGIFVTHEDTMIYYYGASSNQYRNLMAPYLLQWNALCHAQKRECKIYDFLGVASPDETDSSLAWVTDFKMKLSPDRRKVSDAYIWVYKPITYTLLMLLKKICKK